MKQLFYLSIIGFALFEIASVYFIMPMPGGSQEVNSIDLAYALYSWRWFIRGFFVLLIIFGARSVFVKRKWLPAAALILLAGIIYATNFYMAADSMFYQPKTLTVVKASDNRVDPARLILGITYQGEAKAYPIQYLGYHHQVRDSIAGKPIMVTYCTVCRTGRVWEPIVNGHMEEFRLVGMDHYNAMFEDKTTKSWWRQANGQAITGSLKGQELPEFPSMQTTLSKWFDLHPNSLVMQPDPHFQVKYDSMATYEGGKPIGRLTRRDTASWQDKSWIVGVEAGVTSKAYDWNLLQKERVLYDVIGDTPVVVFLSNDNKSFVVLERNSPEQRFILAHDTIKSEGNAYLFDGTSLTKSGSNLKKLDAYQEYWHSWLTFHPLTQTFVRE